MEVIENYWLVVLIVLIGGVFAGFQTLAKFGRWLWGSAVSRRYYLEYEKVEAILSGSKRGEFTGVTFRALVSNPEALNLRIRALRMSSSFAGRSYTAVPPEYEQFDLGRGKKAFLEVPTLDISIARAQRYADGRIDWLLSYVPIIDGVEAGNPQTFHLRGTFEMHRFAHGTETRYCPDKGSETPVFDPDRYYKDSAGDMHRSKTGTPIDDVSPPGHRGPP